MTWSTSDSDNPKPAYGGKSVRIKCYWTMPMFNDAGQKLNASFNQINTAAKILTRYTLSLDWGNSVAQLPFYDTINPGGSADAGAEYKTLRALIERGVPAVPGKSAGLYPPPENRLIVVFTPLIEELWGITITHGMWLPWVLVDPRAGAAKTVLMHEIGHACRLGHYDDTIMQDANDKYDNFLNFQVHEIYRSYWCDGLRPQEWWTHKGNPHDSAFFWEPRSGPTP